MNLFTLFGFSKLRDKDSVESRNLQLFSPAHRNSMLTGDISARYLSLFFSLLIVILLTKCLSLNDFASLQVATSISSIVLWFGDVGLGVMMIQALAIRKYQDVGEMWSLKCLNISILIALLSFALLYSERFILGIFVIATALDLLSDSNLGLRQVGASSKIELYLQPLKKALQCVFIFVLWKTQNQVSIELIAFSIALPSFLLLTYDSKKYGVLRKPRPGKHFKDSLKRWIHSGGFALINLDNLVLSYFSLHSVIVILSLTKKIYSALAILGTAFLPRILFEVTQYGALAKATILSFRISLATVLLLAINAAFFFYDIQEILWSEIYFDDSAILMAQIYLLTLPLNLVCLALNYYFLGLGLNKISAIGTHISALGYLCALYILCTSSSGYFAAVASHIFYLMLWLSVQCSLLWRRDLISTPNLRRFLDRDKLPWH